jgi:hypothetical protein
LICKGKKAEVTVQREVIEKKGKCRESSAEEFRNCDSAGIV